MHPELRPVTREVFAAAPNLWFTEAQIFRAVTPQVQPPPHPDHVRQALAWNVQHGFLTSRTNPETEHTEWRLTNQGKAELGVA